MPSQPIQVIPPGLLGFLQLKNSGRNPTIFPDELTPTLELFRWYMAAREIELDPALSGINVANGAVGFTVYAPNAIVVPANQMWWVREYSIQTGALNAADTVSFQPAWANSTVGVLSVHLEGDNLPPLTGTAVTRKGFASARDFFLPPGSQLGIAIGANETAGTVAYSAALRYVVLPT